MDILLKNAYVITLDENDDVFENCCIGIEDKKINYIGRYKEGMDDGYDRVIDCDGKAVMPGLVNSHTHSSMTLFRNYADDLKLMDWLFKKIFPLEDKLDEEESYWGSALAQLEMIKSGTTAFCDMYFFMDKTAEVCKTSGMRAVLSRGLTGDDFDYRYKESEELYKKYDGSCDGRIKIILGPHSVYTCSLSYLKKIADKSNESGIPLQIHLSETKDEVSNCKKKYGMSPVKLLDSIGALKQDTIAAHCVAVDDEDIEILQKRGVNVAHNPGSNLKLASGIAPVAKMEKKGINVSLGTDGAASNNNLDMLEEVRTASYLQKVNEDDPTALPVCDVLKMATVNGAKALGLKDVGTIESGMKADLIVLNTKKPYYYPRYNIKSAIVYSGNSSDVDTVIIDGNVVMENGKVLTLDEERIYYEVERCAKKLTGR
ncbi:MAG: amidohydrolase [Clostridiales bacterium]|nr:amidohydrolase [Clostridiales bacterium]